MNPIIAFLKLIRWPNLLIIILTQYLMRWCIIEPMVNGLLYKWDLKLQMSEFDFFLLVLSTVMIAAAGNIINDYFDLKIDRVNKPEKIIVGRHIKRRVAMGAHIVINILGILIGGYVAMKVGMWKLALIHAFAAMSLWYYATLFKHYLLLGNLIIALLAALVPLIVGLFEIPLLHNNYANILNMHKVNFNFIAYWIIGYACFAFLLTLAREITKDIADTKGDEEYDSETIPIVWGVNIAKYIVIGIYIITLAGLVLIHQRFLADLLSALYIGVAIVVPIIYVIAKTMKANERQHFLFTSNANKAVSVMGIMYALMAYYIINYGNPF